jgi:hypothetical protein
MLQHPNGFDLLIVRHFISILLPGESSIRNSGVRVTIPIICARSVANPCIWLWSIISVEVLEASNILTPRPEDLPLMVVSLTVICVLAVDQILKAQL